MDLKIGVIIIGSLFWETTEKRINWRKGLAVDEKKIVNLPIRYGRQSLENRMGTYSMVFSNNVNHPKYLGKGLVIPFRKRVQSVQDFATQMIKLSEAEGISETRIFKSWGTVCLIINPFIEKEKQNEIIELWDNLVNQTRQNLTRGQSPPEIKMFGEENEQKSINDNLNLNLNLDNQFKNELKDFDALVATANAVKLNGSINKYPSIKQIAKAINDSKYFDYFLNNTLNSISTFQDKQIAKILKRKYKINLKEKRKLATNGKDGSFRINTAIKKTTNIKKIL